MAGCDPPVRFPTHFRFPEKFVTESWNKPLSTHCGIILQVDFQIVEVSLVEGAPGAIRHVLEAIRRIDISHALITDGNDDLVFSLDDLVPRFTDSRTDSKQALYVALHPDCTHEGAIEPDSQLVSEDIIGYAYVYYPLADNLQTAHTNLKVDPDWEELGIGLALLNVVEKAAGNQNRSIF